MSHQRLLGGKDSGLASVKKFGAYVLFDNMEALKEIA
jgi:hypothetical protein